METLGLALALGSALIYTLGSLFLKSAIERGATSSQVNACTNLLMALLVQPFWLLDQADLPNAPLWQPVLCGTLFFIGQGCTSAALTRGDVSLATPLLGTKILLVAFFSAAVFGTPIDPACGIAALVATAGIVLIAGGMPSSRRRTVGITVFFSLLAAAFYSFTDAFVQNHAPEIDGPAFIATGFGTTGILALGFFLVRDRRAFLPAPATRLVLLIGGVLFGIQVSGFFFAIILSQDATVANVLYSTRSIWSVLAAWTGGHLLGLRDSENGRRVMIRRLGGAILLFGAVLIILL